MANSPNRSNRPIPGDATQILDHEFLHIRAKLIETAAALDRIDRAADPDAAAAIASDFRTSQIHRAVEQLLESGPGRAERVLMTFSQ